MFLSLMHLVTLLSQMPQVLDSQGIDLHYWGLVLKGASEKIQVVSTLGVSTSALSSSCPLLLMSHAGFRGTSIFSSAGNSPFPHLCV